MTTQLEAQSGSPATISRVAFTKLVVADLEGAVEFYGRVLGLTHAARIQAEICGRDIDEVILTEADGSGGLTVLKYLDEPAQIVGEVILGVRTSNIHDFFQRTVDAGGHIAQAIASSQYGERTFQVGFVADREGHLIEVVEI